MTAAVTLALPVELDAAGEAAPPRSNMSISSLLGGGAPSPRSPQQPSPAAVSLANATSAYTQGGPRPNSQASTSRRPRCGASSSSSAR